MKNAGCSLLVIGALCAGAIRAPSQTIEPAGDPVKLPPYEVIDSRLESAQIHPGYEKINHLFDGPFPQLRSGPLIEAILWRHRYLVAHPDEGAVIITGQDGERIKSATTIYTRAGKLYASSNALGEERPLKGFAAADIRDPKKIEKIKGLIQALRDIYLPGGLTRADQEAAADAGENADLYGGLPTMGKLLVMAEEEGDYSVLMLQAGGQGANQRGSSYAALKSAMVQTFAEPSSEVLSWTYGALRDPERAGIVPVALSHVTVITNEGKNLSIQALVFDWDGQHIIYDPDRGTHAKPLPLDPLTGLPYLCVRNGGLLECVNFCATYSRAHPGEKAALLPGEPAAAAFTIKGGLGIFSPALGIYQLPRKIGAEVIADVPGLARLRDRLAAQTGPRKAIPEELPGDDADMELRRAFVGFQAAGVPSSFTRGEQTGVRFTWEGASYVYGLDQKLIRISSGK